MKQWAMALHSETWQVTQLPSGPLWLPAPARLTFWMGWLASATCATHICLGFSQTFPAFLREHISVSIIGVSLTAPVLSMQMEAKNADRDLCPALKLLSWWWLPSGVHLFFCSSGNSEIIQVSKCRTQTKHLIFPSSMSFEPTSRYLFSRVNLVAQGVEIIAWTHSLHITVQRSWKNLKD